MNRILINATQPEELRVAIVHDQELYDLDIQSGSHNQRKSSIYKGQINRIEPSLEAAFVDYGGERHGFLQFREIAPFSLPGYSNDKPLSVKEALKEGQEFEVQIAKEARGTKGATLTTYLSLAGRYMVLMPNNPRAGGISRRVEGEPRAVLRQSLNEMDIPDNMGVIIRTAGIDRTTAELQSDLDYLLRLWDATQQAASQGKAPFLIYQERDVIIRTIRDYFSPDISEIVVDNNSVYHRVYSFVSQVMPEYTSRVMRYAGSVPLFSYYQIESQTEKVFSNQVPLPSGSSLTIDRTEALVAIDINSARATRGKSIEETALNTNLDAVEEIAKQLRLRDLGGLIVIDFIDMKLQKNRLEVEERLHTALQPDRARIQIGKISSFGLLEMSRQRLRPSLDDTNLSMCSACHGQGYLRDTASLALSIMRQIEDMTLKDDIKYIVCRAPSKIATFILNEQRSRVAHIEQSTNTKIIVIPDTQMNCPNYEIERVRENDQGNAVTHKPSFSIQADLDRKTKPIFEEPPQAEKPLVQIAQSPVTTKGRLTNGKKSSTSPDTTSLWKRITNVFEGCIKPQASAQQAAIATSPKVTDKSNGDTSALSPHKRTANYSRNSTRAKRWTQQAVVDDPAVSSTSNSTPAKSIQRQIAKSDNPVADSRATKPYSANSESTVGQEQNGGFNVIASVSSSPTTVITNSTSQTSSVAVQDHHNRSHRTSQQQGHRRKVYRHRYANNSYDRRDLQEPKDAPTSPPMDTKEQQAVVVFPIPPPLPVMPVEISDTATDDLSVVTTRVSNNGDRI